MPSAIHQPHDKFFKLSLSQPQVAREFFTEHLPARVLEKINLATLKLENHSFIDENYKGTEADIVYSVEIEGAAGYVFLLCEHQSSIDRRIAFRLWVYIIRLLEMHLKLNPDQALPLVYPVVIYTGPAAWDAPLEIFPLFGTQSALAREWLFQPFQLLDVHQTGDDEILRRKWCGIVEFALKYKQVRDFEEFLRVLLPRLHQIEKSGYSGFFFSKIVLKYILDGLEARDKDLFVRGIEKYLSQELRGEIMTLAQEFIQWGEEKGMQQGMQLGLQKGLQQGINKGKTETLIALLRHRFNVIPEFYLNRIEQADALTLTQLVKRILEAKTLEEVFE